jgi:pyruvate/2-oxoglutarate dehydrogenase complex dihydrolipoamide dehydrogenase (E3) component
MKNSQPEQYDLLVFGSGAAGKLLSWSLASRGMKTAVIERKYVGGSCPNIACLPSKNIVHSAKIASYFWRSEEFGISKENCRINMAGVRERKRKMVQGLVELHLANYKPSGAELIMGTGRFVGPKAIEVTLAGGETRLLHGRTVLINTGSRATIENISGLREANPLTHIEALELDDIPGHLLIIGGGYVGLEFAQAMRRFGSNVTIVERNGRLAHREDEDISQELQTMFQDEGIGLVTNAHITRVEGKSGDRVKLYATRNGAEMSLEGTHLLVASGRTPNTDGIGLETAGVKTTERGFVKVNERLQTTAQDVWAAGDCAGSPHFTHIAENDFHIVHDNLLGGNRVTTGRHVPFCMFTDPEFARIGLSETEAKEQKIPYRLSKIPTASILRTRTLSEPRGFLKALIDRESDRILGFTVLAVGAGEMLAPVQTAMLAGLPYTALRDAIFTHPTMSEGLNSLFASVPPERPKPLGDEPKEKQTIVASARRTNPRTTRALPPRRHSRVKA